MNSFCGQCQAPISESQRFCRYCGYRLDEGIQDYVETITYENDPSHLQSSGKVTSRSFLSPTIVGQTTPLAGPRRRSKILSIVLATTIISAVGWGILLFKRHDRVEREPSGLPGIQMQDMNPNDIRALKETGLADLSVDDLVQLKIHGIGANFIKGMIETGLASLTVDDLVQLKIHGVDATFVKEISKGLPNGFTVDDLVQLKIHGVDGDFIRGMAEVGLAGLSIDDLVQMKIHGVDVDFIKSLKQLGYRNPSVDDLIEIKNHGMTVQSPAK